MLKLDWRLKETLLFMKKEMNLKSRRKWIMGGLAAFASVALLTTGFAVWVVGVSNKDVSNDVKVNVDTAANKSVSFEMKILDTKNTLKLAESKTTAEANKDAKKIIHIDDDSTNYLDAPLSLNIQYTISYGAAYEKDFNAIAFEIVNNPESKEGITYCSANVDASGIKLGSAAETTSFKRSNESNLTYIDAPEKITLDGFTPDSHNNFNLTGTATINFKWGTFFEGKASPATFYNEKVDVSNASKQTKDTLATEITEELNVMHNQMDDKTLQLKATLIESK